MFLWLYLGVVLTLVILTISSKNSMLEKIQCSRDNKEIMKENKMTLI